MENDLKRDDLIRRSDVIDALMQYTWRDEEDAEIDDADEKRAFIEGWFPDIPAVDAVEVVRCGKCAVPHNEKTGCPKLLGVVTAPGFFCGFGVRGDNYDK